MGANREDLGKEVTELSCKDRQNSISCGQYVGTAIESFVGVCMC